MNQTIDVKVPFSTTNVGNCMCPKCPVQSKSKSVSSKLAKIKDALAKSPMKREEIPGIYCSTGVATCSDLDATQSCICGGCTVFSEYNLSKATPVGHYCRDGFAK
ncbi:MAG: DUF2769 domain-containing protein [Syntrophaceae bacterium]